jgi:hypothetical protein
MSSTGKYDLFVCLLVGIMLLLFVLYMRQRREKYSLGLMHADPRMIPEFPTFDHVRANTWTRYDLENDDDPYSPYLPAYKLPDSDVYNTMFFP